MKDKNIVASNAIFGLFDGLTSVIGVIVALLAAGPHAVIAGALGLAAASSVGMAAGEFLGDGKRNLKIAGVMGLATLFGTSLPILPFVFLNGPADEIAAGILAVAACSLIAWYRSKFESTLKSWVETFGILTAVVGVTVIVTLLVGTSG